MGLTLNKYQKEAWNTILKSYEHGNKFALLIMPLGSGKIFLSVYSVQKLSEHFHLKKVAYVSKTLAIQYNFRTVAQENLVTDLVQISLYTYNSLLKDIEARNLSRNEFDLIIFEEFNYFNHSERMDQVIRYFDAFHIYFSDKELNNLQKELPFDNGAIYKVSISQLINDGSLVEYQKKFYTEINENINKQITYYSNNEIGWDEYESKLKDLLQKLKGSTDEIIKIQELILSGEIDISEITELNYKKKQIKQFKKLLDNDIFFNSKVELTSSPESVWQEFFEANPWIFGFGVNYIFNTPLEGKKLEQTVKGYNFNENGKRVDALLKTTGIIKTLCFGEIKTHKTHLLKNLKNPYRADCWSISDELAGGVAQIHKIVQKSLENLGTSISMIDENGFKSTKSLYLYKPKSFLIIGSLNEFANEKGEIHEEKFSSFELFRRSLSDIEIITFDELYERANAIVNKIWRG